MSITKRQAPITPEEYLSLYKYIPPAEQLLQPLEKFTSVLYDAFGQSLTKTRILLKEPHNKNSAKWFRPQAIRYYVHGFLDQNGIKAKLVDEKDDDESKVEYEPRVLPGNGIAGNIYGYGYWILKRYKFGLGLPPAISEKRKIVYNQSHLDGYKIKLALFDDEDWLNNVPQSKPNIIFIWELVKHQVNLYLAVPKHQSLFLSTPLILIPNPITTMKLEVEDLDDEDEIGEKPIKQNNATVENSA